MFSLARATFARSFVKPAGKMADPAQDLALARQYLQAIEKGGEFDDVAKYLAPEIVLEILPNRLQPQGSRNNLAGMRASSEGGKKIMARQKYEVKNQLASEDQVALEVQWSGTLAIPYETIPAGGEMRARFAMFLRFKDGKTVSQRNYDCFEPW